MSSSLPISREYSHQFLVNSGMGAAIGAGAAFVANALLISNPIGLAGAAVVGGVVHGAESFTNWLGRNVFFIEEVGMKQVTGVRHSFAGFSETVDGRTLDKSQEPHYSLGEKAMHCLKLAAQIGLSILATAFVAFNAIHFAPMFGITEKTVVALSSSLTLPTTIAVTATVAVGMFVLSALYDKFMA